MLSTLRCLRPLNCQRREVSERVTIMSKLNDNILRHTSVLTLLRRDE